MTPFDLIPVWTSILGLAVLFYVLLDGFDLGVGILYGFAPDTPSRNLVMNSIAPIWDGNETWLILGSVGLFAAFPLAFAIIIPAVYLPIALMLIALVFRGVAFEFRYRDSEHRTFWDHGFFAGSLIATFCAGHRARRIHPGLRGRRPRLRRLELGLLHAFLDAHRRGAGVRLRPARRRLADHEDAGRTAGADAPLRDASAWSEWSRRSASSASGRR